MATNPMSGDNPTAPTHWAKTFKCPFCSHMAYQRWTHAYWESRGGGLGQLRGCSFSQCNGCENVAVWIEEELIHPVFSECAEDPNPDMPVDVAADYLEAREVFQKSPRSAGGLLRLAFEKLLPHLGVSKTSPNDGIGELVKKGLVLGPLQQAMDGLRIFGNQAAHVGFVKLEDQADTVQFLFKLLNYIVEQMITRPKEIQALYSTLPKDKLDGIAKRDGKK